MFGAATSPPMTSAMWAVPGGAKNQDSDIYAYGGQDNGKQQRLWEVMRAGTTTWQSIPAINRAMNSYKDLQLIDEDTFAYTGITSTMSKTEPFIIDMDTNAAGDNARPSPCD